VLSAAAVWPGAAVTAVAVLLSAPAVIDAAEGTAAALTAGVATLEVSARENMGIAR